MYLECSVLHCMSQKPLFPMQNRLTGDCYVQMKSVESAAKAARRLHKQHMGHRYIEIFEVCDNICVL